MEIDKIITTSKDNFWIYKMSKYMYEQFDNYPDMYLTSFQNYQIKKKMVSLVYAELMIIKF